MVEDDYASRRALQILLSRQGWEVHSASTLAEARPFLETRPDVLILDLMLPDGDGGTLLDRVRQERWDIKVVVTTGSSDSARLAAIRRLEPDCLLFKPVDLDELFKVIKRPHQDRS